MRSLIVSAVGLASFLLLSVKYNGRFQTAPRAVLLTEAKGIVAQGVFATVLIKSTSAV